MNQTKTIDIVNAKGAKAGSVDLPGEIFDVDTNIPLIHQVVVAQLAAARQGTHATKTRGAVSGGGKKPWRQKGTGRARQGSIRAPQWTGGGTVHGPQPRSYAQRTPKKMIAAALRSALSDRARDDRIVVIDSLVAGDVPSTKSAKAALSGVAELDKVLVVLDRADVTSWLSVRNLAEVHVLSVDQLNTYDVVNARTVVFTKAALDTFLGDKASATDADAAEADAAELHPYGADSYRGDNPPAGYEIKAKEESKKFHTPSSPWYGRTIAEIWFRTEEAAEAAGFINAVKKEDTK